MYLESGAGRMGEAEQMSEMNLRVELQQTPLDTNLDCLRKARKRMGTKAGMFEDRFIGILSVYVEESLWRKCLEKAEKMSL